MRVSYLIPAAAMALIFACSGNPARKGVALASGIERFIPADTVVLAGARIDQIRETPLYQRAMSDRKLPELDRFVQQTGLDPRRDLTEVVVASNGKDSLLLIRGSFEDTARLEKAILEEGKAKRVPFDKFTLLAGPDQSIVFIDKMLALAAPTPHLEAVLRQSGNAKAPILTKVAALPNRHMWAVATGGFAPVPLPSEGNLANLNRVFQSLEDVTMTMDLSNGLALVAAGLCHDEKNAKQLHDMLRGLIGFGRLSTPSDRPELLRFFDGVRVDHDNRKVKVEAIVPMDLVDQFLTATGEAGRRRTQ